MVLTSKFLFFLHYRYYPVFIHLLSVLFSIFVSVQVSLLPL